MAQLSDRILNGLIPTRPISKITFGKIGLGMLLTGAAMTSPICCSQYHSPKTPERVSEVRKMENDLRNYSPRDFATNPDVKEKFERYSALVNDPRTRSEEQGYREMVEVHQPETFYSFLGAIGLTGIILGGIFSLNLLSREQN